MHHYTKYKLFHSYQDTNFFLSSLILKVVFQKILDLSYKMDLDFRDCFKKEQELSPDSIARLNRCLPITQSLR